MKKWRITIISFMTLAAILLAGCSSTVSISIAPTPAAVTPPPKTVTVTPPPLTITTAPVPTWVDKTANLVNGTITVKAGTHYRSTFIVQSQPVKRNIVLAGSFQAAGGTGNDIQVLLLDDINYTNWVNGHAYHALYDSGKTTVQKVSSVAITQPGNYNLVFNNGYGLITEKTVTARFDLTWQEQQAP